MTKTCSQCHAAKTLDSFTKHHSCKLGRHSWCKACKAANARAWHRANSEHKAARDKARYVADGDKARQHAREWYATHTDRVRERRHRKRLSAYGLTTTKYHQLYLAQAGRCAICLIEKSVDQLVVDHDHATKHVRGLLCRCCNLGIGFFVDTPARLEAAARYVAHAPTYAAEEYRDTFGA